MNAEYKKNTKKMEDFYSYTKVNKNHETKNIEVIHPTVKSEGEFG